MKINELKTLHIQINFLSSDFFFYKIFFSIFGFCSYFQFFILLFLICWLLDIQLDLSFFYYYIKYLYYKKHYIFIYFRNK